MADGPRNPIDAEFEHHLRCAAEALEAEGLPLDAARAEALRRFGSLERHHRACRRLEEGSIMTRILGRPVTIAAMLLALLGAVLIAAEAWRRSMHSDDLARSLQAKVDDLEEQLVASRREQIPQLPLESPMTSAPRRGAGDGNGSGNGSDPPTVLILGAVARPSMTLLADVKPATVQGLIAAAQGLTVTHGRVAVIRGGETVNFTVEALLADSGMDAPLQAGDRVFVSGGERGVVYIDGAVPRPGVYQLPGEGSLTVARLMSAAGGGALDDPRDVRVVRTIGRGPGQDELSVETHMVSKDDAFRLVLRPEDHVLVGSAPAPR